MDREQLLQRKALLERKAELLRKKATLSQPVTEQPQEDMATRSAKFGAITTPETSVQRVSRRLKAPETRPLGILGLGGVVSSALGKPEEDLLPMIGQGAGGMATGFTGAGLLGATGGATLGQGARQLIKGVRGQKIDLSSLPKEALMTGAIEGLTRGAGQIAFRRQLTNELLSKLGSKLGAMKKAFSANPNISIPSEEIYMPLKEATEQIAVPHGPQSSIINKWLRFMEKNPTLSSKNLIEHENDLGQVAKYGEIEKGAFVLPSGVKKPEMNVIAKTSRKQVSDIVDKLAETSGQKGFGSVSKRISRILQKPESYNVTKATGGFGQRLVAAGTVGGLTQNPAAGAGTYFAMQALQSPEFRNLLFKGAKSIPGQVLTKGAKLTMSELARRIRNK